jgi:hypothetical protein
MFVNLSEMDLIKKANPQTFASPQKYFDNFYGGAELKKADGMYAGMPANATLDTSINGSAPHGNYRNYIYGKQLWAQMNIRPTTFTAIPRNQYVKSGFRVLQDFANPAIVPNSVKEAFSHVPDVSVPNIVSLRVDPRVIVNNPYSMTLAQQALDGLDDTVNFDSILEALQTEFSMRVNGQMLMANYNTGYDNADPSTNQKVNYGYFIANYASLPDPTGIPVASLDNLISGYNEYNVMTNGGGWTAGAQAQAAVDLFNIDRHTAPTVYDTVSINGTTVNIGSMDAYVDCATSKRNLSIDLVDSAIQAIMPYWKDNNVDNKVIITGFDTVGRMQQLHYQFQRFIGYSNYQVSYNGVKTCPGDVMGMGISQFKGIPIIADKMTTKAMDNSGVGKMYILDTNTIHHAILIPPTFIQDKTYLARRSLSDIATYYMSSQMVCTKPRANAKITMLQ